MKILKIIRDEDRVQFRHEVQGHQATEERDHTCHEAPLKAFDDALQDLSHVAAFALDVEDDYTEGMTVVSLTVSYTKHGTRSATISFAKRLNSTEQNHRMNTPAIQFDDAKADEEGTRSQCTEDHAKKIQRVIDETERYANGERQQRLLPLDDGQSEGAEPQGGDTLKFETPAPASDGEGAAEPEPTAETKPKRKRNKKVAVA